ncbi:decapping nuclease DXO homolog [Culicoides brevitarsis]|uniref:decapping nuclease DXO homolog n=1 Tax=Culicoides brevitarsis TaxID=469753 RepID=UPI00307B3874
MTSQLYPDFRNYNPSTPFPKFTKPQIVGYFSLDENRTYHETLENLKYLCRDVFSNQETVNFDLNREYKNYVPKPESAKNEKIDHLLEFITKNYENLKDEKGEKFISSEFVCFRGLLRLLMCTPFDNREHWIISAQRYKGNIYLCALETEEKRQNEAQKTDKDRLFCSYGFKFEQYLMAEAPNARPRPELPVKEAEEFCLMYQATLNGHKMLYGAEMDGVDTKNEVKNLKDLQNVKQVELKVKREEQKYYQKQNFVKFKQIKWWCQSFLVGIERVLVGLRDDKGIVYRVEEQKVSEMPSYAKQFREYWTPSICMQFLSDFLGLVKDVMKDVDSENDVFLFEYDPKSMEEVRFEAFHGPNRHSFLPQSYLRFVQNTFPNKN